MANKNKNEFVVIKRWVDDDDEVRANVLLVITDAPSDATEDEIQSVVEKIGFSADGEEDVDFNKGYKVVSTASIAGGRKAWQTDVAHHTREIKEGRETLLPYLMLTQLLTYDELLDKLDDEKRFTLRLPIGLHTALVKASKGSSLNKFCVDALAKSVDYKLSGREKI